MLRRSIVALMLLGGPPVAYLAAQGPPPADAPPGAAEAPRPPGPPRHGGPRGEERPPREYRLEGPPFRITNRLQSPDGFQSPPGNPYDPWSPPPRDHGPDGHQPRPGGPHPGQPPRHPDPQDRAAHELAVQYRATEDAAEKELIRQQLTELTKATFTRRMEERQRQVEEGQKRLDELKARLEERKTLAEQVISRRVDELLGKQTDLLQWEFEEQPRAPRFGGPPTVTFRNRTQFGPSDNADGSSPDSAKNATVDIIRNVIREITAEAEEELSPEASQRLQIIVERLSEKERELLKEDLGVKE